MFSGQRSSAARYALFLEAIDNIGSACATAASRRHGVVDAGIWPGDSTTTPQLPAISQLPGSLRLEILNATGQNDLALLLDTSASMAYGADETRFESARRDLEAAITVGARPVLVRTDKGCDTERVIGDLPGVPVFDDLRAAVDAMLASEHTA